MIQFFCLWLHTMDRLGVTTTLCLYLLHHSQCLNLVPNKALTRLQNKNRMCNLVVAVHLVWFHKGKLALGRERGGARCADKNDFHLSHNWFCLPWEGMLGSSPWLVHANMALINFQMHAKITDVRILNVPHLILFNYKHSITYWVTIWCNVVFQLGLGWE